MATKTKLDLKFGLYKITKGSDSIKVYYTIEENSITIEEKCYYREIGSFFPKETVINHTDYSSDYYEHSRVILTPETENYEEIRKQIIVIKNKLNAKRDAQIARYNEKCRLRYA
jgi:hypothetical protein